jgi:hypothetical protein
VLKPLRTTVAVLIALLATTAALAAPVQASDRGAHTSGAVRFDGNTRQCPPSAGRCGQVAFIMAKGMRRVSEFQIEYEATCGKDPANPILDGVSATKLRTAHVSRSYLFTGSGGYDLDIDPVTGYKRHADVKFGARVGVNGHATGTFEATIKITDSAGAWVDTCVTGQQPVHWTAKRSQL